MPDLVRASRLMASEVIPIIKKAETWVAVKNLEVFQCVEDSATISNSGNSHSFGSNFVKVLFDFSFDAQLIKVGKVSGMC